MKKDLCLRARRPYRFACALLLGCTPLATAGVLEGRSEQATLEAGSPVESWQVSNGATLNMNAGSQADASDSSSGVAISLTQGGNLNATGATIRAAGRAIINNDSNVTLERTHVIATSDGTSALSGVALQMYGGTSTIGDESKLEGDLHAIAISSDSRGDNPGNQEATLNIANSTLISTTGSAIHVGKAFDSEPIAPIAHINLSDGTVVEAGNGNLLEVEDDASVFLTIKTSEIEGDIISADTATTHVALGENAILRGAMQGVDQLDVGGSGQWIVTADSSIDELLTNSGRITFQNDREGDKAGRILTVHGDYVGDGGSIEFNAKLEGDASVTDRLIIEGDTSGTTSVSVNNLGGSGAKTLNGIELITVGGASNGEFTQAGRIVAGAYDYQLVRGEGDNYGNWYLRNELIDPGNPDAPILIVRPEGGAYAANLYAMSTLFDASVGQRGGDTERADTLAADGRSTNLWMKHSDGHQRSTDSSGQLNTHVSRNATLFGADLAGGSTRAGGAWRTGVFAGYGNSHGNSTSQLTNHSASSQVKGYTTGVYGTWYANGNSEQGLYTDAVLQYSWFDAQVSGDDVATERYSAKGVSTSLEAGYVFSDRFDDGDAWFLQPKARVVWSGVTPDDHREDNGTVVSTQGSDTLSVSVGARASLKLNYTGDDTLVDSFKPFVETNWIHNSRQAGVSLDGVSVTQAGTRNIAEFKVGAEGRINRDLTISASLAQQVGSNDFSDTAASLALRLSF
ncbi:type V secretion protein A [Pseudomonas sp. 250J]|uniref:autotransporter outer membrane beta-barrel domain-containing protein n=1 Tax=Pseudomonas TaxID=286 RepID=UPI00067FD011|nr:MULTISPECIES: autotransporter outer membrane beta-barrel domain-containing protein [Pseudomonas]KNX76839.1 type V secretion protein A [Pseudomonas sp. 250J]MCU7282340.1 autotransporter outer membrane beta-barrel domain-containing protein [Pseudomonas peradeniyensis]QZA55956.1 autotransporter outer membrane beta-barrel domain-containing protein [Pseudomonas sp. 2hn]